MYKMAVIPVKHGGGSGQWACLAANGMGSLGFIGDVTADKRSKMNSEVYTSIVSAHIQTNAKKTDRMALQKHDSTAHG